MLFALVKTTESDVGDQEASWIRSSGLIGSNGWPVCVATLKIQYRPVKECLQLCSRFDMTRTFFRSGLGQTPSGRIVSPLTTKDPSLTRVRLLCVTEPSFRFLTPSTTRK